jgi:hypothetical protein
MTLDDRILDEVEHARLALESLEDQAYDARAGLHQAIRRLHAAGGSMREIATALGMSHQRVHQIIGADGIVEVESLPLPVASQAVAITADEDACSFCGAPRRELDKLLAAPGHVFVCAGCVGLAAEVVEGGTLESLHGVPVEDDATCSFCGNPSSIGGVMAEAAKGEPRMCRRCVVTCQRLLTPKNKTMTRRNSKVRCSFCNVSQADTEKLIAGPGVYICDQCVSVGDNVGRTGEPAKGRRQVVLRNAMAEPHPCSFCKKVPAQVAGMVKGGRGRICRECIDLCGNILLEQT